MESKFVSVLAIICVYSVFARASTNITIDIDDNAKTDLKTFLDDLRVTATSAQYTAAQNLRLVNELQDRLAHGKVHCACEAEKIKESKASGWVIVALTRNLAGPLLSWNEARKNCESEGKVLAVIERMAEVNDIMSMFRLRNQADKFGPVKSAFVGLHSLFGDNDWVNIFGQPISQFQRDIWNISDYRTSTTKKCGAISAEGDLTSVDCNTPRVFLCMERHS